MSAFELPNTTEYITINPKVGETAHVPVTSELILLPEDENRRLADIMLSENIEGDIPVTLKISGLTPNQLALRNLLFQYAECLHKDQNLYAYVQQPDAMGISRVIDGIHIIPFEPQEIAINLPDFLKGTVNKARYGGLAFFRSSGISMERYNELVGSMIGTVNTVLENLQEPKINYLENPNGSPYVIGKMVPRIGDWTDTIYFDDFDTEVVPLPDAIARQRISIQTDTKGHHIYGISAYVANSLMSIEKNKSTDNFSFFIQVIRNHSSNFSHILLCSSEKMSQPEFTELKYRFISTINNLLDSTGYPQLPE